ncbi:unnamed protein product [Effrenium voratum]|nr:unnamed protein product [Effrenium voratum]
MADLSAEDRSIQEGAPRIKFACHAGPEPELLLNEQQRSEFQRLSKALAEGCVLLEQTGAAPVLADGLVAGNCAAVLDGGEGAEVRFQGRGRADG